MIAIAALTVIATLYIIPLNIYLYALCESQVNLMMISQVSLAVFIRHVPFLSALLSSEAAPSILYIIYALLYFLIVIFAAKYIILKMIFVYNDYDFEDNDILEKYTKGQKYINNFSRAIMSVIITIHLFLKIFDIKILVFYFFAVLFIYRSPLRKKNKSVLEEEIPKAETVEEGSREIDISNERSIDFNWSYNLDPLELQPPSRFTASIRIDMKRYEEYQQKEHEDNSTGVLAKYVLDGLCPEVADLASQIKKQCAAKNLTTYHQVSAVMALQQSMKYVYDKDSKGSEEYIRYPLETLVEKEGDCDCHSICSAAILYAMGYDVMLLRIIFPENDNGHLAIAVEGADGIPGNFFIHNNKKYYYCEVTPLDSGQMNFKVGEKPDLSGAHMTPVSVKESISNK